MGLRRLVDVKRDEKFFELITKFVEENEGKKYEDNFVSLIKSKFKTNTEEDCSTFFCSELVAALLKAIGIVLSFFCSLSLTTLFKEC